MKQRAKERNGAAAERARREKEPRKLQTKRYTDLMESE